MANVLPLEEKKRLDQSFRARYIGLGSLVLILAALVAILAMVPSFFAIRFARASLAPIETSARASSDDQKQANRAQALLGALKPQLAATSSPTSALTRALAVRPAGISITQISYSRGEPSKIVLTGTSASRDAINRFRGALEKDGAFSSVSIPVSALVGVQEGKFTATLTGNF